MPTVAYKWDTKHPFFPSSESPQPINSFVKTVGFVCKTGFVPSKFLKSVFSYFFKVCYTVNNNSTRQVGSWYDIGTTIMMTAFGFIKNFSNQPASIIKIIAQDNGAVKWISPNFWKFLKLFYYSITIPVFSMESLIWTFKKTTKNWKKY